MNEIDRLIDAEKWKQARALIQEELVSAPTHHYLWMMLSLTYYEQKQYAKALAASRRAVELAPECALALWHYAGSLQMTGRYTAALAIWNLILSIELEDVASGECDEGMDWAMQLVNDVHYRMGRQYQWEGRAEPARESYRKYLHNRSHGVGSIYDEDDVKKYLAKLDEKKPTRARARTAS